MINELKKHQVLLSIMASLVVIRFIIFPVIEWQEQQQLDNELLANKLIRIERVLENQAETKNFYTELNAVMEETTDLFFVANEASEFQLTRQQWLENQIKLLGLEIKNLGWNQTIDEPVSNTFSHTLQAGIIGNTIDAIKLLQLIQSQEHYIEIKDFRFTFNNRNKKPLGKSQLSLNLVFYRKLGNA